MPASAAPSPSSPPHVALLVTCLVDLFRPRVGFAAIRLLEAAGCRVSVPELQTCCGQPAYNAGDRGDAIAIARQAVEAFDGYDYVVAPSGSCAGMLRKHYPDLLADDPAFAARAEALAARTWELTSFLVDIAGVAPDRLAGARAKEVGTVTYHDSCSGLRELGVRDQPRTLLAGIDGVKLTELEGSDICCGFGGTFCVKYPDISATIGSDKVARIEATGAGTVLGGDLGCLMQIAGRLHRLGSPVRARHVAEMLAGMDDGPAIGEGTG